MVLYGNRFRPTVPTNDGNLLGPLSSGLDRVLLSTTVLNSFKSFTSIQESFPSFSPTWVSGFDCFLTSAIALSAGNVSTSMILHSDPFIF